MTAFWLEDPQLLLSGEFLPTSQMTPTERYNATTRLVLILGLLMLGGHVPHASTFLVLSILFIIILYTIQKKQEPNMIERFTECPNTIPIDQANALPRGNDLKIQSPSQFRFCKDARPTGYDQSYISTNQALVGSRGLPKTRTAPVVIAPPAAWDFWSEDYVVPSGINDEVSTYLYQSGYLGTSQCGNTSNMKLNPQGSPMPVTNLPTPTHPYASQTTPLPKQRPVNTNESNPVIYPDTTNSSAALKVTEKYAGPGNMGNTLYPSPAIPTPSQSHVWINEAGTPGDVSGCVYDPQQMLEHNIPSNVPLGKCAKNDAFNTYNANLYTQIIEPGQYVRNEIVDPIQSNMGISFTQQLHPTTCESDGKGGTVYVSHDPRVIPPSNGDGQIVHPPQPTLSNVYDPRLNGYGTSYRAYIDTMSGQPRFFYDDIDAIRRPNFIIRSKIDDAPWADTYGPMKSAQEEIVPAMVSRALAQNKFLNDTLKQREELQERYMRKYNSTVGWQRRQAPIHTRGNFF